MIMNQFHHFEGCLEINIAKEKKIRDDQATSSMERDQAKKGAGRMPWHQEPKKDVTSCEKLRGGANIQ